MYAPINKSHNRGFVALITAILISVSLLILTIAVSFEGYFTRFSILESQQKEQSIYLAEACANTVILSLAQNSDFNTTGTISVGDSECAIVSITGPATALELKVKGVSDDAVTNLYIEADVSSPPNIDIVLWEEVANF